MKERKPLGTMGLSGLWGLVGNSTAMLLVAVLLFVSIFQIHGMHREGMIVLERMHAQEREFNRHIHEAMGRVVEKNTAAIEKLVDQLSPRKK